MFIPTYLLAKYLPSSSANIFICVVVGGLIYAVLLNAMKDEMLFEIMGKIKGKMNFFRI